MSHVEKCPVCDGSGRIGADPNTTYPEPNQTCHGCDGKGWVEVGDICIGSPNSIFEDLYESIKEAGKIRRGEIKASRMFVHNKD